MTTPEPEQRFLLQGGEPPTVRQTAGMFAAQHPFMFLTSAVVCAVALLALAAIVGGVGAHVWVRALLWAWRRA